MQTSQRVDRVCGSINNLLGTYCSKDFPNKIWSRNGPYDVIWRMKTLQNLTFERHSLGCQETKRTNESIPFFWSVMKMSFADRKVTWKIAPYSQFLRSAARRIVIKQDLEWRIWRIKNQRFKCFLMPTISNKESNLKCCWVVFHLRLRTHVTNLPDIDHLRFMIDGHFYNAFDSFYNATSTHNNNYNQR